MIYSKRIRLLREERAKNQSEIAKVLGKSQQGYAHLENDKAKISVDDLITLCKFYDISSDYILGFTNTPTPLPKE